MDNGQADARDSAFDSLLLASKQYEVYREINSVAVQDVLSESAPTQQLPYADWAHPIGLVFNA
jgi:hypothetical protein